MLGCEGGNQPIIALLCVALTLPAPKGGRNGAARFCLAAQALQAWHKVSCLLSNVSDFSLTDPREERFVQFAGPF